MAKSYGVAYVTWDLTTNKSTYIVTRYNVGFDLVRKYETPIVYDSQGNLRYKTDSISDAPFWITQIYDEDWLEGMINEMGCFRRSDSFDYWAGGLLWIIPPSRDRFQMTEDTRYIIDPVEISPSNYTLAWYVPIYWREGTWEADETIYLAGFAIIDASETSRITITRMGKV
jgi:hypothetical protein